MTGKWLETGREKEKERAEVLNDGIHSIPKPPPSLPEILEKILDGQLE